MAAYEVLLLNTAIPQIQAAQSGDTYVVPRDIAINATAIISANSATDALRITQTGAGNALLVEDSANPDSTPFVVTAAGDVGIGTSSPTQKLTVAGGVASTAAISALAASTAFFDFNSGNARFAAVSGTTGAAAPILFSQYSSNGSVGRDAMTLDSSGNLGLGVTPSAWNSSLRAEQIGARGAIYYDSGYYGEVGFANNGYWAAGSADNWLYTTTATATLYKQKLGAHSWHTAASGTAGNAITFTQTMTLDASGNLGIGETSMGTIRLVVRKDNATAYSTSNMGAQTHTFFTNNTNGGYSNIILGCASATSGSAVYAGLAVVSEQASDTNGALAFGTRPSGGGNITERARITSGGVFQVSSGGSVQVGGTAARATTAGTNRLDIFNGTAPVGTLTNGISIYSSSGEAYVMDAAGNATLFSPHDAETNEWIFKSKHTPTGKVLKIDVERLLKFVNDHFGLDAVHEFVEE